MPTFPGDPDMHEEGGVNLDLLRIYLNDHLMGSVLGLELARRSHAENEDHPVGGFLASLVDELQAERATLKSVMLALDLKRDVLKQGAAWVGEKLGRLKFNGRLMSYSPLSRLVALEALSLGTEGRLSMWRTLRRLASRDARLGRFDFNVLIHRAEQQRRALERWRQQASDEAFVGSDEGSVLRLDPTRAPG
ncbi:hypothetical protein [Melittangium boletus]|uniref:Uncharacterized protein n=1 Tax=Melittangium boletus DSM 14713 TaxID=1294270 RepID=A0A286NV59_9BACT|nr:hypothetical protein [Melittangium boletus]ATB26966.1 hypothetical protein MEBOL_000401 [Melittangium boletus DSM 14713]